MFSPNNFTEFIHFSELKQNPNPNPYLTIDMLLDVVVKKKFPLLSLGWYLLCVVSGSGCLPRDSSENTQSGATSGNVSVTTIPFLNFVKIYWIQCNSFRNNSHAVFPDKTVYPIWLFWYFCNKSMGDFKRTQQYNLLDKKSAYDFDF